MQFLNAFLYISLFFVTIREDRSSTGHILGPPKAQPNVLTSQRNLTPLACGVLRCLTHIAMLLGTCEHFQVNQVILRFQLIYIFKGRTFPCLVL